MTGFEHHSSLWLPRPLDEVFAFFADAHNLEILTPPWLRFEVLTPRPIDLSKGVKIDYRLRVHGLPIRWQSEITAWEPPRRFVDEQLRGPYRIWRHEHHFREERSGTVAEDHIVYAVPGGALINRLFVARDVEKIFAFRSEKLRELFGQAG
ncbi:MAG: SRPBCC family protein [Acidobacteria bacterium]|nr:SRPBCC family protein [Acidobacteriota bacterium]